MKRLLLVLGCAFFTSLPQARAAEPSAHEPADALRPIVAGYGVEAFAVGEPLYTTDFDDPENWDVQLESKPEVRLEGRFSFADEMLDIYAPNVGCTAWLKQDFEGPLVVVCRMRCPVEMQDDEGIMPRPCRVIAKLNAYQAAAGDVPTPAPSRPRAELARPRPISSCR